MHFYILSMNLRQSAFSLLIVTCISLADVSIGNEVLIGPVKKMEWLASQPDLVSVAKAADGVLTIDELALLDDTWSKELASQQLNNHLQYYFQDIIDQPGSPFISMTLFGSQGETLAGWPIPSQFWIGNSAHFVYVMADEQTYIDQLSLNPNSDVLSATISVPVLDRTGELFGVLQAKVKASLQSLSNLKSDMGF